jgi:hypothetical protein
MAGSSRAVDLAFRKQFRIMESRARIPSKANMRKPTRMALKENELQTYNEMLTSAITFFEGREDEVVNLPADSPEKLTIEAVMGVLNQFRLPQEASNDVIRENTKLIADKFRSMFQDRSSPNSPIVEYVNKLREGMLSLHNSIQPASNAPAPEGDPEGEGGGEGGEKPAEAPEEPPPAAGGEAEGEDLAKQLGLA